LEVREKTEQKNANNTSSSDLQRRKKRTEGRPEKETN